MNDFIVENDVLVKYNGKDADIVIPEGITKIGKDAFGNCENIKNVNMPDSVVVIDEDAFSGCKKLQKIQFSKRLIAIEIFAFFKCESLEEIILPSSLKNIEDCAFLHCSSLKKVYIPETIEYVGHSVFNATPFWDNLTENLIINKIFLRYAEKGEEYIIPDDVEVISGGAFAGNQTIKKLIIPQGVKIIASEAFRMCKNLKEVYFPNEMMKIEYKAFYYCEALEKVFLPEKIKYIGSDAFAGTKWEANQGGMCIINGVLTSYFIKDENVFIPEGVTEIVDCVFMAEEKVKNVSIPKSMNKIDKVAFYNCNLSKVTIHSESLRIEENTFCGDSLTIIAPLNSPAMEYAINNKITFIPLTEDE